MIRQDLYIEEYDWCVTVFYCVSRRWTREVMEELAAAGCSGDSLRDAWAILVKDDRNTGLTYSSFPLRRSVMVISRTSSPEEFMNSWDHEKGHLVKHVARCFVLDPFGEKVQYLSGRVAQLMFPVAGKFLCGHCRKELGV